MKRKIFTLLMLAVMLTAFAKQPERGYRGFLDWSNSYRTTASFTGFPVFHHSIPVFQPRTVISSILACL